MSTIVTRAGKGSPLTNTEVDANFVNLNTDKIETSDIRVLTNKTIDSITNFIGADHLHLKVKATVAISKGDVLKVTGYNLGENALEVAQVSSASDVSIGLSHDTLSAGDFGAAVHSGVLEGINTAAFSVGTILYPNTSGGLTSTRPTTGTYQAIAYVIRSNTVNGSVLIEASEPQTVLGTLATQNANSVTITGGSVNGTSVGATTASSGAFTDFSASGTASFTSTGAVKLPVGTAAQRPPPEAGMLRFNDDSDEFEGYNGTAWSSVGGSAITNDTSTATNVYPLFANATSGTASSVFTSNAKLLYKPSTGEFQSTVLNASNGIVVNSATVSASYTIPTGSHAQSAGPITVADGITVTISDGSNWVVN